MEFGIVLKNNNNSVKYVSYIQQRNEFSFNIYVLGYFPIYNSWQISKAHRPIIYAAENSDRLREFIIYKAHRPIIYAAENSDRLREFIISKAHRPIIYAAENSDRLREFIISKAHRPIIYAAENSGRLREFIISNRVHVID